MKSSHQTQIEIVLKERVNPGDPALVKIVSLLKLNIEDVAGGIGVEESVFTKWLDGEEKIPLEYTYTLSLYLDRAIARLHAVKRDTSIDFPTRWLFMQMLLRAQVWLYDVRDEINAEYSVEEQNEALAKAQVDPRYWSIFVQGQANQEPQTSNDRYPLSIN